jgi:hypothetical protein
MYTPTGVTLVVSTAGGPVTVPIPDGTPFVYLTVDPVYTGGGGGGGDF